MTLTTICFGMLSIALILSFYRLAAGPSTADRVVALDLLAIICVGIILVNDLANGAAVFIDAAIALALVAFAGTIAFARHLERGSRS